LSPRWQARLGEAEGQCFRAAGDAALAEKAFEPALDHYLKAAQALHLEPAKVVHYVVENMLAEARRLFAVNPSGPADEAHQLLTRVLLLQQVCPEASFWQGLCFVREGKFDLACKALLKARDKSDDPNHPALTGFIDPSFYLGLVLQRESRHQEALRFL